MQSVDRSFRRHTGIYRELGLQSRNKTPKRRVKAAGWSPAGDPIERYLGHGFVHDHSRRGKMRVLTIVDKRHNRPAVALRALDVRTAFALR